MKHKMNQIRKAAIAEGGMGRSYWYSRRDDEEALREGLVGNTYWKFQYKGKPVSVVVTKVSPALNVFFTYPDGVKEFMNGNTFIRYFFPNEIDVLKDCVEDSERSIIRATDSLMNVKNNHKFRVKMLKDYRRKNK